MISGEVNWKLVKQYSVMPIDRLLVLAEQAHACSLIAGDVIEFGVYKGGSSILLAQVLPKKNIHAFESFIGLHNLSTKDRIRKAKRERGHAPSDFAINSAESIAAIRERLYLHGIQLHEGLFSEQKVKVENLIFSFGHCDADTYNSTLEFLSFVVPRLASGGRVVFDDYEWEATPGVKNALEEYFGNSSAYIALPTNQALYVKS